jgi:alpha-glucosidase
MPSLLRCIGITVLFLAAPRPVLAAFEFAGALLSTTVKTDAVEFRFVSGALVRVDMLGADVVRVRLNPAGTLTTRVSGAIASAMPPANAVVTETPDAVYLVSADATAIVRHSPFQIVILRRDGSLVTADTAPGIGWDTAARTVLTQKFAPAGEHYLGFGLRGGSLDRRGRRITMLNVDRSAYGPLDDPLYASIPFYYGVRDGQAYGVFVDSPAMPFFDLDSNADGLMTFGAAEGELDYYVIVGPEMWRIAYRYATLTGFAPLPPLWTLGYQQSRFGYASQQEFLNLALTFRLLQVPCDALYFDLYYLDRLQAFTWNPQTFPDPVGMNAALRTLGFKRVAIVDPVVRADDRLWTFLAGSGYFLQDPTGVPVVNSIFYGDVSWIDFTRRSARSWYQQALELFLGTGIDAVWNDLNEPAQNYMPEAIYDFEGEHRTDRQARNLFALRETAATQEALRNLRPTERPWILSRSGFAGIQRFAANWSGDTLSSFDSLRTSVQMSLSMGLSGQQQFGHDVGGFLGAPSPELFIRWLEFSSFTPLLRNHSLNTSPSREPWAFGEPYLGLARGVLNERYRLIPFLYTLLERAARIGQPVLAPTVFHFAQDPQTYTQDTEFMLGPWLLVAPVLEAQAVERSVYLPKDSGWYDMRTAVRYEGGQVVSVPAPLGSVPVFVREGTLLPRGPTRQFVSDDTPPQLDVAAYPGPDSEFTLYEDDGTSLAYQQGQFLRTRLSQQTTTNSRIVRIERLEGSWTPPARPWSIALIAEGEPAAITLNDVALPRSATEETLATSPAGWTYDAARRRVIIRVPDSSAPLTIVASR